MKLQLNIKLSLLLSLLLVAGTWISCDKDDDDGNGSTKTELINFGPTGAQHGDTIRFFGNNMDKVTEVDFTGDAKVMQNEFKKQSKELIQLVVPDGAQEGFVTLKSPTGDVVSKTRFNLEVLPVITSMTKELRPGENVVIKGKFLDWVTAVTFPSDKEVTTFVSQKIDELVVTVPMDAQTGKLIIFYGGTESSQYETDSIVTVSLPAITAMTPNPVFHDANLTITGTNLDLVNKITFNSASTEVTSFVSQSATQIVVKVPGSTRKGKVTLTVPSGLTVQSTDDLDVVLPVVTGLSPNPVYHGDNVTITGANLDLANNVSFTGETNAVSTFVSQSATQIVVKVPPGTRKGKPVLGVTSGGTAESALELDVVLPVITGISPNPIAPGDNLTITGTNLNLATGVAFTGVAAPVTTLVSQSATQVVVKVPTGVLKGKVAVTVLNSTVTAESADLLDILGGLPNLPDFPFAIYTDALENGYQDWSYTVTHDFNSSAFVRQGSASIKAEYGGDGYQGVTFHHGDPGPSTAGYTKFEFSVYGEPGTGGKNINIVCNGNYGSPPHVTINEGEWTTYSVDISSLKSPSPATLDEIVLQAAGWTGTIHIDHVGLR